MKFEPAFEIEIRNRTGAVMEVLKNRGKWFVISIRDAEETSAPIDAFKDLCQGILALNFDDVYDQRKHSDYKLPSMADVKSVIEWSRGKDQILVHCHAGISRSSAMAYLIACDKVGAQAAVGVLNPFLHWPNPLIVKMGGEFLGDPKVEEGFINWKKDAVGVNSLPVF